jgi:hypothetical protein
MVMESVTRPPVPGYIYKSTKSERIPQITGEKRDLNVIICFMVFEIFIIQKVVVNNNRLLDPGGVQHDADSGAHGLGRQVPAELGANGAGVPVGSGHLKHKKNDCVTEVKLLSGELI